MTPEEILAVAARLQDDPLYFTEFCQVENARKEWVPFKLWPAQAEALRTIHESKQTVILKARQLGLTTICLTYAMWLMTMRRGQLVLLISKSDREAAKAMQSRFKPMFRRLPDWLKLPMVRESDHEVQFANDSSILALPTSAGHSFTANLAILDEFDFVEHPEKLMEQVEPTIDAEGNKLVMLSMANKKQPEGLFQRTYRGAKAGENDYAPVFIPWHANLERDQAWYEHKKRNTLSTTGSLDQLYARYPVTDVQALAPNSLDKRIPGEWLAKCYEERPPLATDFFLPGLRVFAVPEPEGRYVIGADPAEGNPTSDDSAACVLAVDSGQQVAVLQGKIEPTVFASYLGELAKYFNKARVLVERNNHGHAVLAGLDGNTYRVSGPDGKAGWLSNAKGKALMYSSTVDSIKTGDCVIHDFVTFHQLASVEGSSLQAPKGQHDDVATAFALACAAREKAPATGGPRTAYVPQQSQQGRDLFGAPPRDWDAKPQEQRPGLFTRRPSKLFG